MQLLPGIHSPEDVRGLKPKQLEQLAGEIRSFLIDHVSKTGGHLSSNLGVVELTLALFQSFDLSKDKIIWDVGHQAYVHKILTGRQDEFTSLRQGGGLSGFPKQKESPYDIFDTGHASTSISLAYGLGKARDIRGTDEHIVAVIGDGSLTGGMAFEAMNNAGHEKTPLIVVLNDNEMSISRNVGAMSKHLSTLRTRETYLAGKRRVKNAVASHPSLKPVYEASRYVKNKLKYMMTNGVLFEEMGFTYLGPVNGHDIGQVKKALERAKSLKEPVIVHVVTVKGKGYPFAEKDPKKFHGIGAFNKETGESLSSPAETYAKAFGRIMEKMQKEHPEICLITAAMKSGTGLDGRDARCFDVGIAEEHAVTFAAGLAKGGMSPFVVIYSSFLQRAYDQILHDVALQNMPVTLCLDHSGVVGEDGETHQGTFDISYLSHIPGMTILSPSTAEELEKSLKYAYELPSPCAIRYPKGAVTYDTDLGMKGKREPLITGKAQVILNQAAKGGRKVSILAVGDMVLTAVKAAELLEKEGICARVADMRFVKPLDTDIIDACLEDSDLLVSVEDSVKIGGFGSMAAAYLAEKDTSVPFKILALKDEFISHDTRENQLKGAGLDAESIKDTILQSI